MPLSKPTRVVQFGQKINGEYLLCRYGEGCWWELKAQNSTVQLYSLMSPGACGCRDVVDIATWLPVEVVLTSQESATKNVKLVQFILFS